MKSSMLVSVIIPCYNAGNFLTETVNSVFAQTFKNYEIILIDDGSTDNTAEIITSFGDKVKAKFQLNQGASVARNEGTKLAKGDLIQYLDADDLLGENALEKRVTALLNKNADVAYSDWQKLIELDDGTFTTSTIMLGTIEDTKYPPEIALFTKFWCPPAAILYTRQIVDKIGGWNESLPIIQDARFFLDSALVGAKFIHVPGISAYYRVHKNYSLSRHSKVKFVNDCFTNALQIEEIWRKNGGINAQRSMALQEVYAQVSRFFYEHDRALFHKIMQKIYTLNPHYLPVNHPALNILYRYLGHDKAEAIALIYRQIKKFAYLNIK